MNRRPVLTLLAAALALSGCASTRMLKQPLAGAPIDAGAHAAAPELEFELKNVIVRDGPGSWARHAKWDEYRLAVHNAGEREVHIDAVVVVDAYDRDIAAGHDARALAKESRRNLRLYRDHGVKVRAGAPPAVLVAGGAVTATYGAAAISLGTSSFLGGSSALVGAGVGIASGGVALIAVGVDGAVQTHRINAAFERRGLDAQSALGAQATREGSVFFPMTPTPKRIEVRYHVDGAAHTVALPLDRLLAGMHVDNAQASLAH